MTTTFVKQNNLESITFTVSSLDPETGLGFSIDVSTDANLDLVQRREAYAAVMQQLREKVTQLETLTSFEDLF